MDEIHNNPMSPRSLERSGHITFIDENVLYVWGGYQVKMNITIFCVRQQRELTGDVPSDLTGFCGSFLNGTLYIFAGCDSSGYTNHMFTVDLRSECYVWIRITNTSGKTPSPRKNHSSWVHQDRIIYFGGYGCKTMREVQNGDSSNFTVEDMSWVTRVNLCWGWNNEVYIFDTLTSTWILPQTKGLAPVPRSCHAAAILENKGYISGGVVIDGNLYFSLIFMFRVNSGCSVPMGRTMHSMIATLDGTLFVYGGSGTYTSDLASVADDAWQYNLHTKEWTQMDHQHKDKPRYCYIRKCQQNHLLFVHPWGKQRKRR
uniref:Kelch domain containing 1 n=1 Tax=Periophthalmus magnuspinnatus TaxID=409849 RepID=A0A3B4BMY2_9GOBI